MPRTKREFVQASADFEFQGIRIGDPEDFVENDESGFSYLEAESFPKASIMSYVGWFDALPSAILRYFNRRLFEIRLIYESSHLQVMGDWTAISDRLRHRFGKPISSESPSDTPDVRANERWEFPEIDRSIRLFVIEKVAAVFVVDSNAAIAAFNRQKRVADLGF